MRAAQKLRDLLMTTMFRITERLRLGAAMAYLAAGSLIGMEALVLIMSYSAMWPMSIPFVIGTLAAVYYVRRWVRRRRGRGEKGERDSLAPVGYEGVGAAGSEDAVGE